MKGDSPAGHEGKAEEEEESSSPRSSGVGHVGLKPFLVETVDDKHAEGAQEARNPV